MLKKHNKHGPLKWCLGVLAAAGLLLALPVSKPVYAAGDTGTAVQTAYAGFSAVSDVKVNNVSVERYGHYKIAFDGNGADSGSTIGKPEIEFGETYQLPVNGFKRTGYSFTGWNTKKDGTGTSYADKASVPDLSGGQNDAVITLYAQWKPVVYRIIYNLGGHGKPNPSWPDTYTIEDRVEIGMPDGLTNGADESKTPYQYFIGWTGTGVSSPVTDLVIPKGTTGNRILNANWNDGGFAVTCEDWTIDYNGNKYRKLGTAPDVIYAKPGTTVSGSQWGADTGYSTYHRYAVYQSCSTVTVQNGAAVVERYFWMSGQARRIISSIDTNSQNWSFTGTVYQIFKDKNGKELHRDTSTGFHRTWTYNRDTQPLDPWFDVRTVRPDGVTYSVDEKSLSTNEGGQKFLKTMHITGGNWYQGHSFDDDSWRDDEFYIVWQAASSLTNARFNWLDYPVYWDDTQHAFVEHYQTIDDAYKSLTMSIDGTDVTYANKTEWNSHRYYPAGTKIRLKSVEMQPGWKYRKDDVAWYSPIGINTPVLSANIWKNDYTLYGDSHIDNGASLQDAYGVIFNANGGLGSMDTQCVENTADSNGRKLNRCTFTNDYGTFLGWSRNPNATEPDTINGVKLTDGAVMPKNLADPCEYVTLYAVWDLNHTTVFNTSMN